MYIGREGLETTILGLTFKVQPEHFKRGDMKLKCLATISSIYWKSNEESVEGEKQSKPPVLEIKRTDDTDDDKSRADRVQGKYAFRINLLHSREMQPRRKFRKFYRHAAEFFHLVKGVRTQSISGLDGQIMLLAEKYPRIGEYERRFSDDKICDGKLRKTIENTRDFY